MTAEQVHETVKKIKQSFRLLMNGVTARSMREKGVDYKLNWGVSLPDLQQMATEYERDYDLAIALWKEDIRECKILATLLMPKDQMPAEVVDIWMEQIHSQEMVEIASFHLFQHLDYAPVLAYEWMAREDDIHQMAAYLILSRLFGRGQEPNERGINEFLDQVEVALQSQHAGVRHAALNCVRRFAELGEEYENMARKSLHLDFL
ncbi:MAG: DNA alkylation repair protein [Prevotella sp.]|nr:DNA alkylation repair protein [Prevotella sp.]